MLRTSGTRRRALPAQGDQGRLAPLRTELLPPVSAGRPAGRDRGHVDARTSAFAASSGDERGRDPDRGAVRADARRSGRSGSPRCSTARCRSHRSSRPTAVAPRGETCSPGSRSPRWPFLRRWRTPSWPGSRRSTASTRCSSRWWPTSCSAPRASSSSGRRARSRRSWPPRSCRSPSPAAPRPPSWRPRSRSWSAAAFWPRASLRLGWLADYFSRPVLIGYLHGVAVVLVVSQLGKLLGLDIEARDPLLQLAEVVRELGGTSGITLLVGALALAVLISMRFVAPRFPAALLVVVAAIGVSWWLDLEERRRRGDRERPERLSRISTSRSQAAVTPCCSCLRRSGSSSSASPTRSSPHGRLRASTASTCGRSKRCSRWAWPTWPPG